MLLNIETGTRQQKDFIRMSDRSYLRRLRLACCATAFFLLLITALSIASLANTAARPVDKAPPPQVGQVPYEAPSQGVGMPGAPGEAERIRIPGEEAWIALRVPWTKAPEAKRAPLPPSGHERGQAPPVP